MSTVSTIVTFNHEFSGQLQSPNGSTISISETQIRPYDMVLGGLVACFHHTFLDVLKKKRQHVVNVEYRVEGQKRETIPATLELVQMHITVHGASDQVQADKCFELAKKYCSVYQTLSYVAQMGVTVEYSDAACNENQ